MASKSIITSLCWIKKGYARAIPVELEEDTSNIKKYQNVEKKIKR